MTDRKWGGECLEWLVYRREQLSREHLSGGDEEGGDVLPSITLVVMQILQFLPSITLVVMQILQ